MPPIRKRKTGHQQASEAQGEPTEPKRSQRIQELEVKKKALLAAEDAIRAVAIMEAREAEEKQKRKEEAKREKEAAAAQESTSETEVATDMKMAVTKRGNRAKNVPTNKTNQIGKVGTNGVQEENADDGAMGWDIYGWKEELEEVDPSIEVPAVEDYSPAYPEQLTVTFRLKELQNMVRKKEIKPDQMVNYYAVLEAYRNGTMPDGGAVFAGGRMTTLEDYAGDMGPLWVEEINCMGLYNHGGYDIGLPGDRWTSYPYSRRWRCHVMRLAIRLDPALGGDPQRMMFVEVVHDTGSTSQTIWAEDLANLAPLPSYQGWQQPSYISTVSDRFLCQRIVGQVALRDCTNSTWITGWIRETFTVLHKDPNNVIPRLSGAGFRRRVYIGHGPMRQATRLYVAEQRGKFVDRFPGRT